MKNTCLFVGCVLYLTAASWSAKAEAPFTAGTFKEACAAAARTKRIVVVDFYTTWCGPCKMMDQKTWKDSSVRDWLAKTAVCSKIDAEKETALAKRYKIDAYPTILLVKANGVEIDRLVGFRDASTFLTEARQALAGKDSVARAKARMNSVGKDDPMERLKYARALRQKEHYAEALKEFLWCLDEGGKSPAFAGVRLSFLLNDIKQLGEQYPQALDALKQRRDAAQSALDKGAATRGDAIDFAAYNDFLGQPEQTLVVYNALKSKSNLLSVYLYRAVFGSLMQQKRYGEVLAESGGVGARIEEEIRLNKQALSSSTNLTPELRSHLKQLTVEKCAAYYEALVGTDRSEDADKTRAAILAFDGSAATYTILVEHAARAGKPETVQKLVALAKSALSPADFKQVELAAGR